MSNIIETSPSSENPQKRPRTRQRIHKPPPSLDVPDINDDAPERKRVLNVLAQRRYRQRKRQQRIAITSETDDKAHHENLRDSLSTSTVPSHNPVVLPQAFTIEEGQTQVRPLQADPPLVDLDIPLDWPSGALSPTIPELLLARSNTSTPVLPAIYNGSNIAVPDITVSSSQIFDIDPALLDIPTNSSPSRQSASERLPTPTFPDSFLLPVPELKLLQAFMRLAKSLKCKSSLWDLTALSPFNDSSIPTDPAVLASYFAPTTAQKTVPHHPIIDFLPWASVRDRLIGIFSLPDELRPPCASGPLALVQLAYDMEDSAEGIRIWGHSPCNGSMWEVGQVLFQRWWFVFDRQVVEQSNRWRSLRGAPELRLDGDQNRIEEVMI